jgi:TP901 family phage tail tape measure protein
LAIVITLEVDDKGSAVIRNFSNNANNSLNQTTKSTDNLTSSLNKMGDGLYTATTYVAKFAVALGVGALTAFATGLTLVTKQAGEFEQAIDFLGAIINASDSEMTKLTDTIMQLGMTTNFTGKEVADAATQLGQAGFTAEQIMQALPGTLALATAGTLDLVSASDIASSTLRSFGFEASQMSKVADVLAKTANDTNTNVLNIGEGMKYVSPLARTAGLSFQEVSAAIGLLGNVGIQGSMAGTTLRAAIAALLNPTKEEATLLAELGVNVTTSGGKIVSLTEVIRQLQTAGVDTGQVMQIFGLRGGPGMAALISMGSNALKDLTVSLENAGGTADEVAKAKLNNFTGQMGIASNMVKTFMVALGSPMLEIFKEYIMSDLIPAIGVMLEWVKLNKDEIAKFAEGIVNFVRLAGTAMSDFLAFSQSTLMPVIATIFKSIGDTIGFVSATVVTLIDVLSKIGSYMSKIPDVVKLAIPGLGAFALATEAINNSSTGMRDSLENLGVTSISLGNNLSNLTMSANDSLASFNSYINTTRTATAATQELDTNTSTLAEDMKGNLQPSLIDAEYEYQRLQNQQALTGESELALADLTYSASADMSNSINDIAGSWDNVGSSINNVGSATESLQQSYSDQAWNDFNQANSGTTQAQISNNDWIEYLQSMGWSTAGYNWDWSGGANQQNNTPQFQSGGIVPGNPNQAIPAIVHGGETILPYGSNIVIQLTMDGKILAEEILDLNDRNIMGMGEKFTPTKKNIKNFQQMGV